MRKIRRHVQYPMLLPLRAGLTYTLRAVIEHRGGDRGGHYVAYVRAADDLWLLYDDSAVPRRVLNPLDVLAQQAYMLFYEQR